ncbi:MAG: CRTAC1 family protein [Planctomyces sp.]
MSEWWERCSGSVGAAMGAGALILTMGCTGEQPRGAGVTEAAGGQAVVQTEQERERILRALTSGRQSGAAEQSGIRFRELGKESGFEFVRYDDMRGQRRILEVNGGGAAIFDVDGDGWLDVFLTNGCVLPTRLDRGQTPGRLFRNLHQSELRFGDCSEASGLLQRGFCCGCAVADVDHDGFEDLYLTAVGGNQFWKNNGDGTFTETATETGTKCGLWGSSAAFGDLNGDSQPDLYVANYLDVSEEEILLCPEPRAPGGYIGCTPAMFRGVPDAVYLSDGAGGWRDVSGVVTAAFPGKALGVVICDLGGDRRPEVYVANDGQPNFLLVSETAEDGGLVGLRDRAVEASAAVNYEGFGQASMGIAAEDFNRDGRTDLFLTHFYRDTNTLYVNRSQGELLLFDDGTRTSLLGLPSLGFLGFGVSGMDADNDGWSDLLVVNGHVDDRTWFDAAQPYRMTAQMFQNRGDGTFREVTGDAGAYFGRALLGRGLATGDLDRDGRLDAVVSNQLDPSAVLRNESDVDGRSLVLKLVGVGCARTPVGVRVRVLGVEPVLWRQLVGGGSYHSADACELHLGGLEDREYDLEVQWPDGSVQQISGIRPGRWAVKQQGAAALLPW